MFVIASAVKRSEAIPSQSEIASAKTPRNDR
jgi:hypothetical protein